MNECARHFIFYLHLFEDFGSLVLQWKADIAKNASGLCSILLLKIKDSSGGLNKMVTTKFNVSVTVLGPRGSVALAHFVHLKLHNMLFINIYLPLLHRHDEVNSIWDILGNYISRLLCQYPDALVIIAGNFSVHIGESDAFLQTHFNWSLPSNEIIFPLLAQQSKNKTIMWQASE